MSVSNEVKPKYERLSQHIKPIHYNLSLTPSMQDFSLTGKVDIDVEVKAHVEHIKLHADGLQITKADIMLADGKVVEGRMEYGKEMLTLRPPLPIAPQKLIVSLAFIGQLRNDMKGFYRSTYKGGDGKERILASTQFEATFARQAFPYFDEPAFKATFDVELTIDKTLTALSNMPVMSESAVGNDLKTVNFARTPIMSSYLLAFAVGELEYLEGKTMGGVDVIVYTGPGKKDQGKFSLDVAIRALDWYGEWFDIPCVLPKCDLIAIPDFRGGAMENWGLVTFREVTLLFDPAKTSSGQKARIALVVAHELAHLWFGNLVTMVWWTDLWLKEGFARFMEYLFVAHNYDEFKSWLRFARDEISTGMRLDALRSSHPIEVLIDNPNELDEIFDAITYDKSNCVNRMLYEYLGEATFQKGLRIYLKKHQYANAITEDLWAAHSEASKEDIKSMMSGWTQQMGFPLITVSEDTFHGSSRVLKLKQERFIVDGSKDEMGSKWIVPITAIVGPDAKEAKKSLLYEAEGMMSVDATDGVYIKLNAHTGGFYRVAYSEQLFDSLLTEFHTLPPLDRYGFASDCFAVLFAGKYTARQFLSLVTSCSSDEEYAVWGALDDGLNSISNVLAQTDASLKKRLDVFIIRAMTPLMTKLGWEPPSGEETIREALTVFEASKGEIKADMRTSVYGIVARNGTHEQFHELLQIFETCGFSEVERSCIFSLAQTSEMKLQAEFFDYAFKLGKVRPQDLFFLISGAVTTPAGQEYAWNFFKNEQPILLSKLGGAENGLYQRVFKCSAEGFCSETRAKEVESFFCSCKEAEGHVSALDRPIRQVAESIRVNERLLSSAAKSIESYLAVHAF